MTHHVNIIIHVIAGILALLAGIAAIWFNRFPKRHKQYGKYFVYLLATVVSTGFLGWLFFRSNSFLLMLTLISGYACYAGFRVIKLREKKGRWFDAAIAIITLSTALVYAFSMKGEKNWSPAVVYPILSALVLVTTYDLSKYYFLHKYIKSWWLYEHIYKMLSAFSAILSAFTGTVFPDYKPYSQVGPSVICFSLIFYFIALRAGGKAQKRENRSWFRHPEDFFSHYSFKQKA